MTLEQLKDEIACEEFVWPWYMLTDAQKARIVDKVAEAWADLKVQAVTKNTLIQQL